MGTFRFKLLDVVNERSAMKVNTDGVLLGAAMTVRPSDRRLLDIGTGTGTIALMAAQRMSDLDQPFVSIEAIDMDQVSAEEAAFNFSNSPWADTLRAMNVSLDDYARSLSDDDSFDLIFSNPPYFDDSLQAPQERRNNARQTTPGLSYREILDFAASRLS